MRRRSLLSARRPLPPPTSPGARHAHTLAPAAARRVCRWEHALGLFDEARREHGLSADTVMYGTAMSAANKGGMWGRAAGRDEGAPGPRDLWRGGSFGA